LLRRAFEANPPPLVRGRRLKLLYATQADSGGFLSADGIFPKTEPRPDFAPQELELFVNDPRLVTAADHRSVDARIRAPDPYPALPIILRLRPRVQSSQPASRLREK